MASGTAGQCHPPVQRTVEAEHRQGIEPAMSPIWVVILAMAPRMKFSGATLTNVQVGCGLIRRVRGHSPSHIKKGRIIQSLTPTIILPWAWCVSVPPI